MRRMLESIPGRRTSRRSVSRNLSGISARKTGRRTVVEGAGLEGLQALAGVRLLRLSAAVVVAAAEVAAGEVATVDSVVVGEAVLPVVVEAVDVVATGHWTIRWVKAMEAAACSIRRSDIALRLHC